MSGEYAPSAIFELFDKIKDRIPEAQLSGILGDQAHTYGYHRARAVLPQGDYSVYLTADREGDQWAASALDINLPPDLMKTVTSRLLRAAKAKSLFLGTVREFCGTTDGVTTHSYDLATGHEGFGEWDDSHLWHIHLSFYRRYANDSIALAAVANVLDGFLDYRAPDTSTETQIPKELIEMFIIKVINNPPATVGSWVIGNGNPKPIYRDTDLGTLEAKLGKAIPISVDQARAFGCGV